MTEFKAVVFDWAGTVIDFGSIAPMRAFVDAFDAFHVSVSVAQARGPMGMPKRDHIASMMADPDIAGKWQAAHGHAPEDEDIDKVYAFFVPTNERVVAAYATLVPGGRDAIEALRAKGLKIGSTTGYTRSIMAHVIPAAAEQGFSPDTIVCSDDLIEGRPGPLGIYQCMVDMAVYPPSAIIKVDDTEPGIAEGVSAGCLTVGVALSGNYVGKTPDELSAMTQSDVDVLRSKATDRLKAAGADHVIDTIADLPELIDRLT